MATLTAIVPATDSPPALERCLAAIAAALDPPEELIVISEPPLLSEAVARNRAADQASGDLLVFVDADVEVHVDVFRHIRAAFEHDAELSGLIGSYDDCVATSGTVAAFRNLLHHHVHQRSAGVVSSFWTGLGAIRRETFLAAGGFDEKRVSSAIQDVEFGARIAASGVKIELDPELLGTHLKEWTLRSMVETDFRRRGVPWIRFLLRERSLPATFNLSWRDRSSAVLVLTALGAVVTRKPIAAAAATGGLIVLNRRFYGLLRDRGGLPLATAGVGLHAVHHLTAIASVPAGIAAHFRNALRNRSQRRRLRS